MVFPEKMGLFLTKMEIDGFAIIISKKEVDAMDDNTKKRLITAIIIIIYVVSPVDLFPGPVDDAAVTLIGSLIGWAISKD